MLTTEGDKTIVQDLSYILSQLNETDRNTLIAEIGALLEAASKGNAQ
jgi:hypothetical protein